MTTAVDVNALLVPSIGTYKSQELQFNSTNFEHSQPRSFTIVPDGGLTTATVPVSSDHETKFMIPQGCYNFGKSNLRFDFKSNEAKDDAKTFWIREDLLPFISVHLRTQTGQVDICNLMGVDHYHRIVSKAETPIDKFLTMSFTDALKPCDKEAKDNLVGITTETGSRNYIEPEYYDIAEAKAAHSTFYRMVRFEDVFKNHFLGMDKMLYFPEALELSIRWQAASHWGIVPATKTDATGAADNAGTISLSNLSLIMKRESDAAVIASLTESVLRAPPGNPFVINVPDVTYIKLPGAVGTDVSVTFQLGAPHGKRIKKIFAIPINDTESKGTRYDSGNIGGAKVGRYQTLIDGNPIQPNAIPVSATSLGDWFAHRDKLSGTALSNFKIYRRNWFICDDFSGQTEDNKVMNTGEHNVVTGHPVNIGSKYELISTNAAAVQWYFYVVGQKTLRIAPAHLGGIGFQ